MFDFKRPWALEDYKTYLPICSEAYSCYWVGVRDGVHVVEYMS